MMDNNEKTYGAVALFLVFLVLAFFIIKPFLVSILSAVILSYIFHPVYRVVKKVIKSRWWSSLLTTVFIIALIALPSFFIANKMTSEVYLIYLTSKQKLRTGSLFSGTCEGEGTFLCNIDNSFKKLTSDPKSQYYMEEFLDKSRNFVLSKVSNAVLSVPKIILSIFVMFFITFYLLMEGKGILKKFEALMPFKRMHQEMFVTRFADVTHATIYGALIIAFVQGALGALGFVIFGVTSPIIWGLVMAFFALVPFVGPALIYVPAAAFMVLDGMSQNSNLLIIKGIFLLLWGVLVVSSIDNILRPKIVGDQAKLHPIVILLGVFGGLSLIGFLGIVLGPLILAFFITFLQIYLKRSEH